MEEKCFNISIIKYVDGTVYINGSECRQIELGTYIVEYAGICSQY